MNTMTTERLIQPQVNDARGQFTRIKTVTEIRRPIVEVFDFATTPVNWLRWHPASLAVRGATDHSLKIGEEAIEEFNAAGRRGVVTWRVRQRIAPQLWVIEAENSQGQARITYVLAPTGTGTRFTRLLEYRMASRVWRWLDRLLIARRMARESAIAVERLKRLLEQASNV
jgi:Polyketide cyclase / dehydrase and lipid transport